MNSIKHPSVAIVLLLLLQIIYLSACTTGYTYPLSPRETMNFNRDWKYCRGDFSEANRPDYDDSGWENIGVPHSFSIPYFMSKDFYVGYGWYRKTFRVTADELSLKNFLEFDGVFQEAEVYVNGKSTGSHIGGYTGFSIDISKHLVQGENVVAIRVNNIWRPDLAPRAGEHVFSGGIYRNVRRVVKAPAHIDWYGTFVTTPGLAESNGNVATVRIATDVRNDTEDKTVFTLKTVVLDKRGKEITSVLSEQSVEASSTATFEQIAPQIQKPDLWHPGTPNLYKAVSLLYQDNQLLDMYETTFGFRWFEWTADKGFFLNGKHFYFHGANVHQDHAGWGDAVTEAGMKRDIQLVKDAGFTLVRGSHYPHAPAFSQACDELGMLFWPENAFWGIGGFKEDGYWDSSAYPVAEKDRAGFDESVKQQLTELIRIHRNHPSIVLWSMSNEPFFTASETIDPMRTLLEQTVQLSKKLDPNRPVAIGGAQRPVDEKRIDMIGDIAGYNGDGSYIAEFQHPGFPTVVSEYGSVTADRPGNYDPGWGDLARNDAQNGFDWRSGQAIWCAFDHGSIAGSALGKMGIIDYFRIPKRAWYWYRNEYKGIAPPEWPSEGIPAALRLTADKTKGILADGTDDVMLLVTVVDANGKALSNSPVVELQVISGPGEFPTGASIRFENESDIRILDGQAAIEFRSWYAGRTMIRAVSPGLTPAEITLDFTGEVSYQDAFRAKERPYIRYIRHQTEDNLQVFGPNNPTFSSSAAPGFSSVLAADNNPVTFWRPDEADTSPWWLLDVEKELSIRNIRLWFPEEKVYRYKVEVSSDRVNWELILDNSLNDRVEGDRQITLSSPVNGRFIRVSLVGNVDDVALADVQVVGVVVD